ncbi:MAG TPA: hypothetical protein VGK57_06580, partial [Candidatus Binatia bacterium]
VAGRGSQFGPKIIAERRAGKYLVDFFVGGKGTAHATLYPAKVLAPIQSLLVLPEVLDQSKWWQGKHRYVDAEGKYIFAFVGNGTIVELRYNTNLVSPKEFTTYWDLLNPKWKGKIVATDPRMNGMDTPVLFFYYHPKLGPEFMRRLYGEMDVTIPRLPPADRLAGRRQVRRLHPLQHPGNRKSDQAGASSGRNSRAEGRRHVERRRWHHQLHR